MDSLIISWTSWAITNKVGLQLMSNVLQPLAKSVLIPLGLTAAASATDAGIYKKFLGFGTTTIMKIVKSVEDSRLLIKDVTQTIENETKEQTDGLVNMLLGSPTASLLENLLSGTGAIRASCGVIRAGQEF